MQFQISNNGYNVCNIGGKSGIDFYRTAFLNKAIRPLSRVYIEFEVVRGK